MQWKAWCINISAEQKTFNPGENNHHDEKHRLNGCLMIITHVSSDSHVVLISVTLFGAVENITK
eukprot:6071054-Amphidinium_carterae.2